MSLKLVVAKITFFGQFGRFASSLLRNDMKQFHLSLSKEADSNFQSKVKTILFDLQLWDVHKKEEFARDKQQNESKQ